MHHMFHLGLGKLCLQCWDSKAEPCTCLASSQDLGGSWVLPGSSDNSITWHNLIMELSSKRAGHADILTLWLLCPYYADISQWYTIGSAITLVSFLISMKLRWDQMCLHPPVYFEYFITTACDSWADASGVNFPPTLHFFGDKFQTLHSNTKFLTTNK